MDIIQWLFDPEIVSKSFNWPVHVEGLIAAKHKLDSVVSAKASAEAVLEGYKLFAGAIGPSAMNALSESDDAFPEVNHSDRPTPPSPGRVTLYVDRQGRRVLAACTKEWGWPPHLSVE